MSLVFLKKCSAAFFPVFWPRGGFSKWSIRARVFFILVPSIMGILGVSAYILYRISSEQLDLASSRHAVARSMAQSRELSGIFESTRDTLLLLASMPLGNDTLRLFMSTRSATLEASCVELAWIRPEPGQTRVYVQHNGQVLELSGSQAARGARPVTELPEQASKLQAGQVWLGPLQRTILPVIPELGLDTALHFDVFRFYTPAPAMPGEANGLLALSLDARTLRNVLSLHSAGNVALDGNQRVPEKGCSFFFDLQGWILFQSEGAERESRALSAGAAAGAGEEASGLPAFPRAFRPDESERQFWAIVDEVKAGRPGSGLGKKHSGFAFPGHEPHVLGYAPVFFSPAPGLAASVIGGIGHVDRNPWQQAAKIRLRNLMFIVLSSSLCLLLVLVFFLSRAVTRPILRLADAVRNKREAETISLLTVPDSCLESATLKDAINELLMSLRSNDVELPGRDEQLPSARQRESFHLGEARSVALPGVFGEQASRPALSRPLPPEGPAGVSSDQGVNAPETRLNDRQHKLLLQLKTRESITRQEYQDLFGTPLPVRTALYDLQDLAARGLIVKTGKGRATRYRAAKKDASRR